MSLFLRRLLCRLPLSSTAFSTTQRPLSRAAVPFAAASYRPPIKRHIRSEALSSHTMTHVDDSTIASTPEPASPTAAPPTSPPSHPPTASNPADYHLDDIEQSALATPTPLTLVTYNVNSLRTLTRRLHLTSLHQLLTLTHSDILCCQETKASAFADLPAALLRVDGYDSFWAFDTVNKGRNGVVTYARHGLTCEARVGLGWGSEAAEAEAGDVDWTAEEGRVVMTDHTAFVLFNIYFPNAGRGDERLAYKLRFYKAVEERVRQLRAAGREVVVVGDVNTAHRPIDIHDPKIKGTGFLPIERDWLDKILLPEPPTRAVSGDSERTENTASEAAVSGGVVDAETTSGSSADPLLVDVWRWLHPTRTQYSFWDQRSNARGRNRGWRIDYVLATPHLTSHLLHAAMHPEMRASDHSPVTAYFDAHITQQAERGGSGGVSVVGVNRLIEGRLAKGLEDVAALKGSKKAGGRAGGVARDEKQKSLSSFFGGGGQGGAAVAVGSNGEAAAEVDGEKAEKVEEMSTKGSSGSGSKRKKADSGASVRKRSKK